MSLSGKLTIAAIAVVVVLLSTRIVMMKTNGLREEKTWFVKNLHYDFTARVDSIVVLKNGKGFLMCSITRGGLQADREDSLNRHLMHHKKLSFVHYKNGKVNFFAGAPAGFRPGDSVYVNSGRDQYFYFRDNKPIRNYSVTESLLGVMKLQ